jgi:hypothetical protein
VSTQSELGDIRDSVRAFLEESIPGLRAHDTWPGNVHPPAVLVRPTGIEYDESFAGDSRYDLELVVVVRRTSLRGSQDALDEYVSASGDRSIPAKIAADPGMGARVESSNAKRCHSYGVLQIGKAEYLGAVIDISVLA